MAMKEAERIKMPKQPKKRFLKKHKKKQKMRLSNTHSRVQCSYPGLC